MGPLPPFDVKKPWFRQLDDRARPPVAIPERSYRPDSLADLIAIVEDAVKQGDPALELRAAGSHWAISAAAVTQEYAVETAQPDVVTTGDPDAQDQPWLNSTLYDVIPDCLSQQARRFLTAQTDVMFDPTILQDHSKFYLYHVEAGTRIWELYCRLDEGDDEHKRSLAGHADPAIRLEQYQGPWAMETLGGAGGQTIAGAFTTGTHGGDIHLSPIADAVQAIHLVGPTGKQYWFEQSLPDGSPLVDDTKLTAFYGKLSEIEIVRDFNRFRAVMVSVGRMGIIYSVVLRVVRQYALHEARTKDTWLGIKTWINNPLAPVFANNRFIGVVINPNAQFRIDDDHSCFVTRRTREKLDDAGKAPGPFGRAERRLSDHGGHSLPLLEDPGDFSSRICASDSPAREAISIKINEWSDIRDDALLTASGIMLALAVPFLPLPARLILDDALDAALLAAAGAEVVIIFLADLRDSLPVGPLGKTMGLISSLLAVSDYMEIFRYIAESLMQEEQKPRDYTGISYGVMDIHNYLDVGCSANGDSLEVFFDASSPNLTIYIERLFQRVRDLENGWITGAPLAFGGYVALRFMSESLGLLAMQQLPRMCSLEIAGFLDDPGTLPFLTTVEQDAIELGATVHWGQRNDLTMKQVERMYDPNGPTGNLFLWRKALHDITENGRFALFSTPFTRERGLEVVQPILKDFTVSPTNGCADGIVTIGWTASANPPGSLALLEIRPSGSSGPPATTIALDALDGEQDVALPAGASDFTLVVATTLNGRTLADRRTVFVRGFSDHEAWRILRTATCLSVDGQSRWGVEISFASTVAPTLTVEKLSCDFTGAAAWTVRRSGIADVGFSPAAPFHLLPTPPTLRGTWLFFVNAIGCAGAPPQFAVDFQLICDE